MFCGRPWSRLYSAWLPKHWVEERREGHSTDTWQPRRVSQGKLLVKQTSQWKLVMLVSCLIKCWALPVKLCLNIYQLWSNGIMLEFSSTLWTSCQYFFMEEKDRMRQIKSIGKDRETERSYLLYYLWCALECCLLLARVTLVSGGGNTATVWILSWRIWINVFSLFPNSFLSRRGMVLSDQNTKWSYIVYSFTQNWFLYTLYFM